MKKIIIAFFACVLLVGCSSRPDDFVTNTESRSTTWIGQTAEDLYENFGVPTKGFLFENGERHLVYHSSMIMREWTERVLYYCDIIFVLQNNRVVDWMYSGNQCSLNVR